MRIIAGFHKGRRLRSLTGQSLRPTSGRVKEALFSILGPRVSQATMVDLFAGTGAIGIEAFSRGAHRVIFVEPNPASLQILRHNLQQCGNPSGMRVIPKSAWQIVQDPHFLKQGPFDIMFVDPPYQASGLEKLLFLIGEHGTISPTGILVVEHFSNTVIPRHLSSLSQVRQKQYGRTVLTFFEPSLPSLDANRCVPRNV